jgi:hypothetical protein
MPELKAGARLKSAVCTTEVIVVKTPAGNVDVRAVVSRWWRPRNRRARHT